MLEQKIRIIFLGGDFTQSIEQIAMISLYKRVKCKATMLISIASDIDDLTDYKMKDINSP